MLLETDSIRVVGMGREGYRLIMVIEQGHKDAMGDISWHLVGRHEFRSDHTSIDSSIRADALLAALDRLHSVTSQADKQLQTAKERIIELEYLLEEERIAAMGEDG